MVDWLLSFYERVIEFIGISFAFFLACGVAFFIGYSVGLEYGEQSSPHVVYIPKPKEADKPVLNTRQVKTKHVK